MSHTDGGLPPDTPIASARVHLNALLLVELADASRLKAEDETGTTRHWQRFVHRARQAVVSQHHGRFVAGFDTSLVLSFDHARSALRAAADLHRLLELGSADRPAQQQMRLRAAIHALPADAHAGMASGAGTSAGTGAVSEAGIRRMVSLNARALAGETVLSAAARESLADGLDATLEDLGESADPDPEADADAGTDLHAPAIVAVASTATPVQPPRRPLLEQADGLTRAYRVARVGKVIATAAEPQLPVPVDGSEWRAAIAVVPFESRGLRGEQLAIGDLIADGVIARLSRTRHLRVISRLSTQALRGRACTVDEMQRYLGATHVLTGEFAESGGRLSVRYQLRDLGQDLARDPGHGLPRDAGHGRGADSVIRGGGLSASLAELLQLDSEPIIALAQQVHDALFEDAGEAVLSRPLPSLRSFALLLGGIRLLHRSSQRDFAAGFEVLDYLTQQHPACVDPLIWQAKWYAMRSVQGLTLDRAADARAALDCTARALDAEPNNSFALAMQGFVHCVLTRDQQAASSALQQAVALNPNESLGQLFRGMTLGLQGRFDEGITSFGSAAATSPLDPACYMYDSLGAYLHLGAGHQAHAIALARRALRLNREDAHSWRALTIAQAELGQLVEARASLHEVLRVQPGLTLRSYLAGAQADDRNRERFGEALRRAGLPA